MSARIVLSDAAAAAEVAGSEPGPWGLGRYWSTLLCPRVVAERAESESAGSDETPTPDSVAAVRSSCDRWAVVAEAAVAFVLADALVDKLGGDTMDELLRSLEAYRADLAEY